MLFDELESRKRECDALRNSVETLRESRDSIDGLDLYCLMCGRRKVFEDCVYLYPNNVKAERGDDDVVHVTSFEDYRERIYAFCPAVVSKAEFFAYFDAEFRAKYELDKEEALADLEKEEGDDD